MDLTVLDRQRAALQRLHPHHSTWQDIIHLSSSDQMPSTSNSNNNSSVVTKALLPKSHHQCNSRLQTPLGKRKLERQLDVAEDVKAKGLKSEEFGDEEKSEVTAAAKTDRELSSNTCSKVSEVQKPDYIHVRARRGQATDSHSLAERARREKISKKMKCLQDLVPGCNKVIGKAGMLDEIINYVQSLQKQVEFLSMKLAAINPTLDFSIDNFFAKEIPAYLATLQPSATQFDATSSICYQYPMQQGTSSFVADMPLDHSQQPMPQKSGSVPIPDAFLDPSSIAQMSGWESDWPNLFNAGFH